MPNYKYSKMAVDFGTSNTVVAFWDEDKEDVVLHHIPDVTLPFRFQHEGKELEIPYIPSQIYYESEKNRHVGYLAMQRSLENGKGLFRWMKAYIRQRRNIKYPIHDGALIDNFQAAEHFLDSVISYASEHVDISTAEVAFTIPVESFEHYTDWLSGVCPKIGVRRYRFIDESTACIFGYDTHLQTGDIFLIFDFGGGTLDISIIRIEERVEGGKGCRVLGKAGCDLGGRIIDGWIYGELLKRAGKRDVDVRPASGLFMRKVEEIKERLSTEPSSEYEVIHEPTRLRLKGVFHRAELEDLLEEKGLYSAIQETIERALSDVREKGITQKDIKEAILVGGTSQIPSVRRQVRTSFGDRTRSYRAYDAVARGACRYLTKGIESLYDHIQHDYAIKSYNSSKGIHDFITLIPRGTKYPTNHTFKSLTLKAVRNEQRFFGIDIYEIAQKGSVPSGAGEVIFDLNGCIIFETRTGQEGTGTEFWMNEDKPMFIEAIPPGKKGTPRFSVTFRVDSQKRLLVTVRDIETQKLLYDDHPVVKLK